MDRRVLIGLAPLTLLVGCSQPAPQSPAQTESGPPSTETSSGSSPSPSDQERVEVLALTEVYHSPDGIDIELTDWKVAKFEESYGTQGQNEGDPLVYFTVKVTNTLMDALDIQAGVFWSASNGAGSTEVPVTGSMSWKPRWPDRLVKGRSASQRYALVGKVADMAEVVLTLRWADAGADAIWQGDVSKLAE